MTIRLFSPLSSDNLAPKIKHYSGLPPSLTGGKETRMDLGAALFLAIEETPDGMFLYRYNADGTCVGDTWHMNLDDAQHQAAYEYGKRVQEWTNVPPDVDIVAFALGLMRRG